MVALTSLVKGEREEQGNLAKRINHGGSAKEVIEKETRNGVGREHSFLKKFGKKPKVVTGVSEQYSVDDNPLKAGRLYKQGYNTHIHNHPMTIRIAATPSGPDLEFFLQDRRLKNMVIAQTDPETGEILGYTIVRKPRNPQKIDQGLKKREEEERRFEQMDWNAQRRYLNKKSPKPKVTKNSNLDTDIRAYDVVREPCISMNGSPYTSGIGSGKETLAVLKKFCNKYSIKCRFVPMPDYQFDRTSGRFVKERR